MHNLIVRHLGNYQTYPFCPGVAITQRGEAYCIPWTLSSDSLQSLKVMINEAGTERRTVTFQQMAFSLRRNGRVGREYASSCKIVELERGYTEQL